MALQTVTLTSGTSWTVPTKAYILRVFLIGGGGAGGSNGGGGGGGGRVTISNNYSATPGSSISYSIGGGGSPNGGTGGTTTFGSLSAAGGFGGASNGGAGGSSSSNVYGSVTNYGGGGGNGDSGAGGASPAGAGNGSLGPGAAGFLWNGTFYGGGGGGGCGTFNQSTSSPIPGAPGGAGGGGAGGGEESAGASGAGGTGGGGGGGAHSRTTTRRGTLGSYNGSPAAPYQAAAAQNGGSGGSGAIQILYDEAEARIVMGQPGVAEGNSVIVYIYTKNITNGSVLPFTLSGSGISSNDFSPASLSGSFTISSTDGGLSGYGFTTITIATDVGITEGEDVVTIALNNGIASTTFKIGDLYQYPLATYSDTAGNFVTGLSYTILSVGTTDFTALGAASNTVGVSFTATGTGLVSAGQFVIGKSYTIVNPGNTKFTKLGAANNLEGTTFTATGTGFITLSSGSMDVGQPYCIIELGDTDWNAMAGTTDLVYQTGMSFIAASIGSGTGVVMPIVLDLPGSVLGTAKQGSGTASSIWYPKLVQIADYNAIQSKVANIVGTGSGNSGYGQTVLSSQVTTSNKLTVSDWARLKYDIINAYYHQTGTVPTALVDPAVGALVKANATTQPYKQYSSWADVIDTQKFDIGAGQFITRTQHPITSATWATETAWPNTTTGRSRWDTRIYSQINVYWNTANEARAFFNSGGEIRFTSTRTGGVGTPSYLAQNNSWTSLLLGSGTQGFGGNRPTANTGTLDGTNFYRLNNGFQVWYTSTATNPYSTNTYRILARSPGVTDNSSGTASSIEFLVEWLDNHAGSGGGPDGVDGTFRISVSTLEASGILQPSGAGNFTVVTPTIILGTVTE